MCELITVVIHYCLPLIIHPCHVICFSESAVKRRYNKQRQPANEDADDDSDEFERDEQERRKDLEERDAFADRLKKKDKEKTRNVMSKTDKKVSS